MNTATTASLITRRTLDESWRAAWRRHRELRRRCQGRLTRKGIHELRLATRRLFAHLELFAALDLPVRPGARKALKRLMRVTGRVRDAQVQLGLLGRVLTARQHPDYVRFRRYLQKRERRFRTRLAKLLAPGKLDLRASPLVGRIPAQPGPPVEAALAKAHRRLVQRRSQARPGNPRALHRFRVAMKRYRYLAEIFPAPAGSAAARAREGLKRMQSALGDRHDLDVLAGRLQKFARKHGTSRAWLRAQRFHQARARPGTRT